MKTTYEVNANGISRHYRTLREARDFAAGRLNIWKVVNGTATLVK